MSLREINPWALLVLLVFGALTALGRISEETLVGIVTGLAIPAGRAGYQAAGATPRRVTIDQPADQPVPTTDVAGDEPVPDTPDVDQSEPLDPPAGSRAARVRRARSVG